MFTIQAQIQTQIQIQKCKYVTTKSMQSVRNKRCPRQTAESAASKGAFVIRVPPRKKRKQKFKIRVPPREKRKQKIEDQSSSQGEKKTKIQDQGSSQGEKKNSRSEFL